MVKETLALAVGVVAVGVLYALVRHKKSGGEDGIRDEKIYVDELNMGVVKSWFKDKLTDPGKKGVMFYPTKANLGKWKIDMEESENVLIQAVYDERKDEVTAYREISFSGISAKLSELLDSNGGTVVVDR